LCGLPQLVMCIILMENGFIKFLEK